MGTYYVVALVVEPNGNVRVVDFHRAPDEPVSAPGPDGLSVVGKVTEPPGPRPSPEAVAAALRVFASKRPAAS